MFGSARARFARRILRLGLLARAADQHTGPVPDLTGTESVDTEWGPLYLDARDEVILPALREHGVWEPGETALLREHLGPGMTFLDVGAHVGYYTLMAARLVEPGGLVMAFEPSPRNYELLLANVWRNGLGNVLCHPWAVSDANGFVDLYVDERNTGDNRTYASEESRPRTRVRTVALDSISSLRPPIHAVKIDVQGPEEAVIRGMRGLLEGSPNAFVTLEYWPFGLRALGRDERATLRFYRSLGYRVRVQNPEEPGVDEMTDDEILAYCSAHDGQLHTNLVLTRDAGRRS